MIYAKKRQKCLFNDDSLTKTGDQSANCSAHVTQISIVTATATSAIKNVKKNKKKKTKKKTPLSFLSLSKERHYLLNIGLDSCYCLPYAPAVLAWMSVSSLWLAASSSGNHLPHVSSWQPHEYEA